MAEMRWFRCNRIKGQSNRKWRLFACACCRRVWDRINQRKWRKVVEAVEQFSDGMATQAEVSEAVSAAGNPEGPGATAAYLLANTLRIAQLKQVQSAVGAAAATVQYAPGERDSFRRPLPGTEQTLLAEQAAQACLLDDVFGHFPVIHPQWEWVPVSLASSCRTPTIVGLARAAYDNRTLPSGELDPQRLAVLADALEEAGAEGDLLEHLRGPRPHVRGCWAVDLCLGLS
jgi:hypothetical protein